MIEGTATIFAQPYVWLLSGAAVLVMSAAVSLRDRTALRRSSLVLENLSQGVCTGAGERPGGEKIRQTLEDARSLVIGKSIASYNAVLNAIRTAFADHDAGGRGLQTFDMRVMIL